MHPLPIILHLEPDGSSESPGNVEEAFDDQSPFFLWGQHGSAASKTVAAPKVAVLPPCGPSGTGCLLPLAPQIHSSPEVKASSMYMLWCMRAGTCRRKNEVFFLLLSPGLAKGRAGASTELLSQTFPQDTASVWQARPHCREEAEEA